MKQEIIFKKTIEEMIESMVEEKVNELLSSYIKVYNKLDERGASKEILTVKEVASLLGMSERIVRQKMSDGLIPYRKCEIDKRKNYVMRDELIDEIMKGEFYPSIRMLEEEISNAYGANILKP